MIQMLCECESFECGKTCEVPVEISAAIQRQRLIAIIDGCAIGPKETDTLVEKREGYSLYRELDPRH